MMDHGAGGGIRKAHDVVLEATIARDLDVDHVQIHPLARVDGSFAVHRPLHAPQGKPRADAAVT